MKFTSLILIALLFTGTFVSAAQKKEAVPEDKTKKTEVKPKPLPSAIMTQGDFARELVNALGWGGGLSSEPKDREYLQILEGRRTFKFEAEKVYNAKTDDVSVRKSEYLGAFSGESWLGGVTTPSKVRIKVFIPISGNYILSANAKGDGQIWNIAGKGYPVNSGNSLSLSKITELSLKAGELELELVMPPEGALDYIIFTAPDLSPIEPFDGWRFSEPLTYTTIAHAVSSLFGLEENLPSDESISPISVIASEIKGLPSSVSLSDIKYYGKFSGKTWVKTTRKSADITIPFTLAQSGTYDIKLRVMGDPVVSELDGNPLRKTGSPSFDWVRLGLHRLSSGGHTLKIKLPPFGGLDALNVIPRKSSPETYLSLAGITGDPSAQVTYADMEKTLSSLQARFKVRK